MSTNDHSDEPMSINGSSVKQNEELDKFKSAKYDLSEIEDIES